jgi:hypothetical protein
MLLETPKMDTPQSRRLSDIDPLDKQNLETLRRLLKPAPKRPPLTSPQSG